MAGGADGLVPRLAAFISDFIAQLSSDRYGSLAQVGSPAMWRAARLAAAGPRCSSSHAP